jgi:N-acyl-D-amino-acid deacylase
MRTPFFIGTLLFAASGPGWADDDAACRDAVKKGLALVLRAGEQFRQQKTCFACHHDTLPMLAATEALRAGLAVDAVWLKGQTDHTRLYFEKRVDDLNAGYALPGGAASAAYGLWALDLGGHAPDATTDAIVSYLLQVQGARKTTDPKKPGDGRWVATCFRPPMQGSTAGDTVLSLLGVRRFAGAAQQSQYAESKSNAEAFLSAEKLATHQDRLWRFWGLHHFAGDESAKNEVRAAILAAQREDGSWAQRDDDKAGDAYSTGQTLYMLLAAGASHTEPALERARERLLFTQHEDGSWFVDSRVEKKVQPFYDNADPHGDHQWVSIAATAWAVAGLARSLP